MENNNKQATLTRVEVIEHGFGKQGRAYVHDPRTEGEYDIELSFQDGGKTLKIFITKTQKGE